MPSISSGVVLPNQCSASAKNSWAKLTRDSVIAGLAFAYSVWAIWGSGEEWLAKGFMLLLFGIPVFVWMRWRRGREIPVLAEEPERIEVPRLKVPVS